MKAIFRAALLGPVMGSLLLLPAPDATARELSGVKMDETAEVAGKTLKLNGMGLRKKSIFKVYVAGLYLEAPSKDGPTVAAADAPKLIRMQFLRDVDKAKLIEAYKEGFEANAKEKAAAQKASIDKFYGLIADVKEGSVMTFTYTPGAGTVVARDGKDAGTIEGKDFAEALFLIWLGPHPPSEDLKKGLLGS